LDNTTVYIITLLVAIVGAVLSGSIASRKGRSAIGYGILGFVLPVVGVIVALIVPNRRTQPR
jgi:uncharacterized membrane protein YeaQ/YmgE (transglycosylase-associated protein family)